MLYDISHEGGVVNDIRMESIPNGAMCLLKGNSRSILVQLLSRGNKIEAGTLYSMFLEILDSNSHGGVILTPSLVDESITNLASLYDIKIIPLGTRNETERSIRVTFLEAFR